MKKFTVLLLMLVVLFAACSRSPNDDETKAENTTQTVETQTQETVEKSIDEKAQTKLIDSAKYLTKAVVCSSKGFSSDVKNPAEKLIAPNNDDQKSVTTFIIMMMANSNPEEKSDINNTIYNKNIYMDENKNFHIKKDFIPVVLKDVFAVTSYDESLKILEEQLAFETDYKKNEYVSSLAFGAQYDWECDRLIDTNIDTDKKEITVNYTVKNVFGFADEASEEITQYSCKNVYTYDLRDSNEYYLTLKSMEITDFVKSSK